MAELSTLARPYAEAVFRLASEKNALSDWSDRLATLAAIAGNEQMQAVIADPNISASRAAELIGSIASADEAGRNLLAVLAANDRLTLLPEIAAQYEVLKAEAEGVLEATIVSARAMNDAQKAELMAALKARFGRDVQATVEVDESLIGGAVITVGDQVIDGSVRGRLQKMAAALTA
ncbi:MAG: F0F1 ATP synthase subunit delta [Pseudomonadota bacterium]